MEIVERIKENFYRGYFGKSMAIPEMEEDYPAWTIKQDEWIGVAVPMRTYMPFSEEFSHVRIHAEKNVSIGGIQYDLLLLTSSEMETRNEFAYVCADFIAPGENGERRSSLITDPTTWWKHWKKLIGNTSSDQSVYDTFGELLVVERMLKNGENPSWSGAQQASHDVETEKLSIEVKTTSQRYRYEVTINSIYQMVPTEEKPLFLSFIRVESSMLGRSIDDVAESLKKSGYDPASLESALTRKQLEKGRPARYNKYRIIEWKQYPIDKLFPAITEASFKGDRLPQGIIGLTYTADLSGVPCDNLL